MTEISRQGDGIARVHGFVIFVKGGKKGQKVRVRITNVGARFASGEIAGGSAESQKEPEQVGPQTKDEEKPELRDYKSEEPSTPTTEGDRSEVNL
ncbi:MAG: TRAM domain-containing protein [Nitrososphaera sp.]